MATRTSACQPAHNEVTGPDGKWLTKETQRHQTPHRQRAKTRYFSPMPYDWTKSDDPNDAELHLWPHQSMTPGGFSLFLGVTFGMILMPLIPLLGTVLLWGLLPFLMLAVAGVWFALARSQRNAQVLEVLRLTQDKAHLVRHNPRGPTQEWQCNRYWARPNLHQSAGPVPHYVTLSGGGREVEIGAFLSEDERKALYQELLGRLRP